MHAGPRTGDVAGLARSGGGDVRRRLARGGAAVMTTDTIAADTGMIEAGRCPGTSGMTGIAGRRSIYMVGRFAHCRVAVMATRAAPAHTTVIKM